MDVALADIFRCWLRRCGLIGFVASVAFGTYVQLPLALNAAHSGARAWAVGLIRDLRREDQSLRDERSTTLLATARSGT